MVDRVEFEGKRMASPRFGLTERIVEVGRATYRKLFKLLMPICGREHPDEATYKCDPKKDQVGRTLDW